MTPRIYADFNALAGRGDDLALILKTMGTLKSLSFHQIKLEEGIKLTFWDGSDEEEDLEAKADVYFDRGSERWMAGFQLGHLMYVPKGDRREVPHLCYKCRTDLGGFIRAHGLKEQTRCPSCGLQVWYPILAPEGVR